MQTQMTGTILTVLENLHIFKTGWSRKIDLVQHYYRFTVFFLARIH